MPLAIDTRPAVARGQEDSAFLIGWDDGDPSSWVTAGEVALAYRQPMPDELAPGRRVLGLYGGVCQVIGKGEDGATEEEADVWFLAKVPRLRWPPWHSRPCVCVCVCVCAVCMYTLYAGREHMAKTIELRTELEKKLEQALGHSGAKDIKV